MNGRGKLCVFTGGKYEVERGIVYDVLGGSVGFYFQMDVNIGVVRHEITDKGLQRQGAGSFRGAGDIDGSFCGKGVRFCKTGSGAAFVNQGFGILGEKEPRLCEPDFVGGTDK